MTLPRISVVLPVYNEYDNIAQCLRGLWSALSATDHEILVCYDFDEDTTLKAIAEMSDAPRSLRLVKNTLGRGPQNAIKAGFAAAQGDVVVTSMADLSDPPELIPRMAEKIRAGADVVSGSRYMSGGSQTGGPFLKRTLSEIAGRSLGIVAGLGTCDATSNFRAYSKRFLDTQTVEAEAGFEIALELTVKAHLSGRKLDEVPSSWVDRSAGQSRFRLWTWMPNYLRWYLRAMAAPLAVWAVFVALVVLDLARAAQSGDRATIDRVVVLALAALGLGATLVSRRALGRSRLVDALHAAIWAHPAHARIAQEGFLLLDLLASASVSFALIGFAVGWPRLWSFLKDAARRAAPHFNQSNIGLALLFLVLWQTRMWYPDPPANADLDPSWQAAMAHAFQHDLQAGTEILFTFGPLGYFAQSPFVPALFWPKCLGWEICFKLVLTLFFVLTIARQKGALEKALGFLALLLPSLGFDTYYFVAITAISVWIIDRTGRSGRSGHGRAGHAGHAGHTGGLGALTTLGVFALALISLVKFTYLVLISACLAIAAAQAWYACSRRSALSLVAVFAAFFVAIWLWLGQSLLHIPAYVWRSLHVASAYNEAMAAAGAPKEVYLAALMIGLIGCALALHVLAERRDVARWAACLVVLAALFLSYKAGFVRHMTNSITFFTFAGVSSFFLFPDRSRVPAPSPAMIPAAMPATMMERARRAVTPIIRCSCVVLGLYGYGLAHGHGSEAAQRLISEWVSFFSSNVGSTFNLPNYYAIRSDELDHVKLVNSLQRIQERVGKEPVDVFFNAQGAVFLNDLEWQPRPAFQSYLAYTPDLQAINARFLESRPAPAWILLRYETIDGRLPSMDDGEAVKLILREWRPVLAENGFLLMHRDATRAPGGGSTGSRSVPRVEIEKTIGFGEEVDLSGLEGRAHLLALDIRYSLWGRVLTFLNRAPAVAMEAEFSDGDHARFRIIPGMMRSGVVIEPWLDNQSRWIRWYAGSEGVRLVKFRLVINDVTQGRFQPGIALTVSRDDDLVPEPTPDLIDDTQYSMFETQPAEVATHYPTIRTEVEGRAVLVVHAPSEVRYELRPGHYELRGSYGLLPAAYDTHKPDGLVTDGAGIAIVLHEYGGSEKVLLHRFLNPVSVSGDRGVQELDLDIKIKSGASLMLRTGAGGRRDGTCDWCWWSGLVLQPIVKDAAPR